MERRGNNYLIEGPEDRIIIDGLGFKFAYGLPRVVSKKKSSYLTNQAAYS